MVSLTNGQNPQENAALCQRLLRGLLAFRAADGRQVSPPSPKAPWGAVVRTYCLYKEAYVKDTRTGVTDTHVRRVLDGHIDHFLTATLRLAAEAQRPDG